MLLNLWFSLLCLLFVFLSFSLVTWFFSSGKVHIIFHQWVILTYLLRPCYASWHIGQGQVSFTLLCCWLFFLLCPRCVLFPLFHFWWCASMLFLVFLFVFSLLVSTFVMSSDGLRRTWPSHLHRFWINKVSMSLVFVMSCRSLLKILFGQNIFIIFLRQVFWKLESLLMSSSVILQHSEPHRSTYSIQLL